jgi:4-oxalocrotonate tautomerase
MASRDQESTRMPIIQVNMLEGRTVAQKRAMIAAITDAVVDSLGVRAESVRIMINEMHPEHFALAGVSAGQQPLDRRGNGHGTATDAAPAGLNGNGQGAQAQ